MSSNFSNNFLHPPALTLKTEYHTPTNALIVYNILV